MKNDFKTLFLASESARKKQEVIIQKQEAYISELESKNQFLSDSLEKLTLDYENVLSICDKQQAILDQVFKENNDN